MSCSSHCCGAEKVFDDKGVKKSLKKYRKKGPEKFNQKMIDALSKEGIKDLSLLDIGGGLGVRYQNEQTLSVGDYMAELLPLLAQRNETLILEPGRSITANAGVMALMIPATPLAICCWPSA